MKQEQLETYILLRQSGELGEQESVELEDWLAENADARALAKDYATISEAASLPVDDANVSEITLERIHQAARQHQATSTNSHTAGRFKPLLALAAAIVLLFALGTLVKPLLSSNPATLAQETPEMTTEPIIELAALVNDEVDQGFTALEARISQVSDELFSGNFWGEPTPNDLDEIASELLQLESNT
ncbi:MAG: hypothetical protein ACI9TH_000274 [Kiritimatiellia bacterium]|jgi:hypothetical protein